MAAKSKFSYFKGDFVRTKHLNVRISNRSKIHTIPDSFCVGMKTIPDRDSVHTEKTVILAPFQ